MTEPSSFLADAAKAVAEIDEALTQFRSHIPTTTRDYGAITSQSGDIVIDGLGLKLKATPRIVRNKTGRFGAELRFVHTPVDPGLPATTVCTFYIFPTQLNVTLREATSETTVDATDENAPGHLLDTVLTKASESAAFAMTS